MSCSAQIEPRPSCDHCLSVILSQVFPYNQIALCRNENETQLCKKFEMVAAVVALLRHITVIREEINSVHELVKCQLQAESVHQDSTINIR